MYKRIIIASKKIFLYNYFRMVRMKRNKHKKSVVINKETKELLVTGISFVFGTFCLALCYNLFFVPNDIVVGGMSGLAIVLNKICGINSQVFIYATSILLLVVSFVFLGKDETSRTVIGSLLYPLFVTFTEPISKILVNYFSFQEILVTVVLASLLYGFSNGIIYKFGYTTGGSDVIMRLLCKYFHISEGKSSILFNILIILLGAFTFGVDMGVYAIIILVISSTIVDKIMIGMSDSKKFMIYTRESRKVKNLIEEEFGTGFTIFPTVGGYSHIKGAMIMCVIRNRDVNLFKYKILEIDSTAFFVISDCYEVQGGVKRSNLPFI